jgi:hypothetical protein
MSSDEAFLVQLLGALDAAGLEAIVVGTTAAILQGVPILTEDVDLLIRDTPKNRQKLEDLCATLGVSRPIEISPASPTLRLVGADVDVDILFDELSGGLSFASIRSRALSIPIGDAVATVACLPDVIHSKRAADRPKDRAQLHMLDSFVAVKRALDEDAEGD